MILILNRDLQEGVGELESKIEKLLNEEKQMRLNGEVAGTKKAVTEILQLCYDARAWKTLNDQIVLLSKRRGQLKQVFAYLGFRILRFLVTEFECVCVCELCFDVISN